MNAPTKDERLQKIVETYRSGGNRWPTTPRRMAEWAISQGLWAPQPDTFIGKCAEELSHAMRVEYITDPQGRRVRAKHAARVEEEGEQLVLWDDIRSAPPVHMEISFAQRRQQVVGDCRQLKNDVDSYNEIANPGPPIQMIFDFTDDMAELEIFAGRLPTMV